MQATKADVALWSSIILINVTTGWQVLFWLVFMVLALVFKYRESQ